MNDFKKQIDEDLEEYKEKYPKIPDMAKPEWAFNFWVLDKLFSVDESMIMEKIIDRHDKGVDCYVWHEDTRDLYLIQNKYLSEDTIIPKNYILDDLLVKTLGVLEAGNYDHCSDLQDIYNKYSKEPGFTLYFYIYATNNKSKTKAIEDGISKFNVENATKHREARFFSLEDINKIYFEEPITNSKTFKYTIRTINKGTILAINNNAYKTNMVIDARYVLTPVLTVYEMYNEAKKDDYSLFAENIRDYLGSTGAVNKNIKATLEDPVDRNNFFFYNNGITMIVDDMMKPEKGNSEFEVINPQIVNGCQTVSTISETLGKRSPSTLADDFKNVYVMIKILKIPKYKEDKKYMELYDHIVLYNNSQNSINEKAFEANKQVFKRVQSEFETKGFLVCLKQSDKYSYKQMYKSPNELKGRADQLLKRYGLEELNKTTDFIIDLEKLLQVFVAFKSTPVNAIQNKSKLLKHDSDQNKMAIDFIKNPEVTSNDWLAIYLLYYKIENLRKKKERNYLNPFYVVYCFANYECAGKEEKISPNLATKDDIDRIVKKYNNVLSRYYRKWIKNNEGKGYNDMIKSPIDQDLLKEIIEDVEEETMDEDL